MAKVKEPKRIWDNYKVVGEVKKAAALKLVIAAAVRDGVKYVSVREFYLRKKDNVWMPGRDGITMPLALPINEGAEIIKPFADFMPMIASAADVLDTMELFDENNAVYAPVKEK